MRILISTACMHGWRLQKIDVKSAFLQTGSAARDVYVIPPRDSADRGKVLWLLLTTAYCLVNANYTWLVLSAQLLVESGFETAPLIPQLLIMRSDGHMVPLTAKIVDDILVTSIKYVIL